MIRIYRKTSSTNTRKPTKATLAAVDHLLALSRVRRPDLEAFLRSGGFQALPDLTGAELKDAARRRRDHTGKGSSYIVTDADKGRATTSEQTVSMSIRTWMMSYYVEGGALAADEFAVVIDPD
jgi:hypothetical protein